MVTHFVRVVHLLYTQSNFRDIVLGIFDPPQADPNTGAPRFSPGTLFLRSLTRRRQIRTPEHQGFLQGRLFSPIMNPFRVSRGSYCVPKQWVSCLGAARARVPRGILPGRVPQPQIPQIPKIAAALLVVKNCFGALSCQKNALAKHSDAKQRKAKQSKA